ncbi:MAG: FHIPEP family type III secretion protein, partial [Proteobacteria bacterium]|nr:FHIPEP family type III secretion protein [Pseudomonadota bacterium]
MEVATAAKNYTLLTIGDGLVAQIPALIISTAAGLVVSRVTTNEDVGQQVAGQMFGNPTVLMLTALILGVLGMIPGMPNLVFLLLAAVIGGFCWWIMQRQAQPPVEALSPAADLSPQESLDASWSDVAPVDVLGLEVGYRLIPLVDKGQDGDLLKRIRGLRKKFAQEIGFLSAPVHIRDNLELKPNGYRITLKGVEIGAGESYPGMLLAINPGRVAGPLAGNTTKDPAFGLPAIWIEAALREQAHVLGYTVVDSGTVVATHLNHVILSHAAELLGRQETQSLLDHIAKDAPKLIEDLVPKLISLSVVQRVLQNLLEENVNIRDMRSIIETLAEHAARTQDPLDLTTQVRIALGRAIVQQLYPGSIDLSVIAIDSGLERVLGQTVQGAGNSSGIEPGLADTLLRDTAMAAQRQEESGLPAVLLVPGHLRWLLSRFLRRAVPQLSVISNAEVPDSRTIKVTAIIGAKS